MGPGAGRLWQVFHHLCLTFLVWGAGVDTQEPPGRPRSEQCEEELGPVPLLGLWTAWPRPKSSIPTCPAPPGPPLGV